MYEVKVISKPTRFSCDFKRLAMKRIICSCEETVQRCRDEISVHRRCVRQTSLILILLVFVSFKSFYSCDHPTLLPLVAHKFDKTASTTVCYMLSPLISSSLRNEVNVRLNLLNELPTNRLLNPFTERQVLEIFSGIVSGVQCLHDSGLAHRDIKLENVLFETESSRPILMDFGSACPITLPIKSRKSLLSLIDQASEHSTISYRAPELFEGHVRYGPEESDIDGRTDVWSLGCLLFGIMYGYSPFECEIRGDRIKVVDCSYLRVLGSIPKPSRHSVLYERYSESLNELVTWILNEDRSLRPTLSEVSKKTDELMAACGAENRWRSSNGFWSSEVGEDSSFLV